MTNYLFTLVVDHSGQSYTTQVEAPSANEAVGIFFDSVYPRSKVKAFGAAAPDLTSQDVIYVTPMNGLVNVWVAKIECRQ